MEESEEGRGRVEELGEVRKDEERNELILALCFLFSPPPPANSTPFDDFI